MQTRKFCLMASCLTILGLLVASCAPAAAPTPKAPPPAKAPVTETPALKTAAPSPTPKATGEEPKYGGTLYISHFGDPASFDPNQEMSLQSLSLVAPSYSGVLQHDPLQPDKVIGDLAEKWDVSQDGKTYTFSLYKGVKWHDGAPFSAEDVAFTLELVRKPPKGFNSPRMELLKAIDKIETPDKDTLKITLQYPSASFLRNLGDGRVLMIPKHVFEAKGNMKKDIVGTGPYKFKSYDAGVSWSMVKNANYFIKGRPYLDGITWYIIPDVSTRFAALRTHRVQVTPWGSQGLPPSLAEIVQKEMSDKIAVDIYPSLTLWHFWMPFGKAPWNDIRLRQAVELAIDRPNLLKVAAEGMGSISGFMPAGEWSLPKEDLAKMPGYREAKEADIAEAKKLMAEAGYAQGIKTVFITRNATQYERAAVALKEQLARVGIEITIRLLDLPTLQDLLYKRNFESALWPNASGFNDPDPIFADNFLTGAPRNMSGFSDPQFDKWYDEQSRTLDPAKRKQIVLDMQRRLHEVLPSSVLYWGVLPFGRWKEVRDFKAGVGNYNNMKFQNVWLAK